MAQCILIVDDESQFRRSFKEAFDGYDIIEAQDGLTAINILKKPNSIDLVVLDEMMPGLKGTETLAELKKIKPGVKVVMFTGSGSKSVVLAALRNKADEFMEKPMNVEDAKAMIVRLLQEKDAEEFSDTGDIRSKVEKVKKLIERNCDKKLTLKDAADHACISPKYLSRAFEEVTGTGFAEYKSSVKINEAKKLLKKGFNISQVSEKLAYASPETFIRAFSKTVGCTPAKFKKIK